MKKYDPNSKRTDAEFLRGIILQAPSASSRLHDIADRLENEKKTKRPINPKDRGLVCRMAGNIAGHFYGTDEMSIDDAVIEAVDCAHTILREVDFRIQGDDEDR